MMVSLLGRVRGTMSAVVFGVLAMSSVAAYGQAVPATAPAPAGAVPKLPGPEEVVLEDINSERKTDVPIHLTYLAGTRGKETVPVVLLHMFKGDRHEMESLGLYLQQQGHAVIMPDLRGHGQSTTVVGSDRKLDPATMPPAQFTAMVTSDMNCVKRFLVKKHNAGELNVDKLVLVGAELGSIVAVNFAAGDWAATDLVGLKQSKDVKALVLISPLSTFKGLSLSQALGFEPITKILSTFIIVGAEDMLGVAQAKQIHQRLERARPKPTKPEDKTLFLADGLKTKLVGSKLLGEKSLGVEQMINEFIQLRVANQVLPWKQR